MARQSTTPLAHGATLLTALALVAPGSAQAQGGIPGGQYGPYAPYAPAADKKAPRLTKVTLKPKTARAKVKRTLTFTLDEPARLSGVIRRRTGGVRTRGRRCVRRTRSRRGPACTLHTRIGTLLATRAGRGGNRASLNVRPLPPGDYTLTLTPTDAAGNVGAAKSVSFRIKPERPAKRQRARRRAAKR